VKTISRSRWHTASAGHRHARVRERAAPPLNAAIASRSLPRPGDRPRLARGDELHHPPSWVVAFAFGSCTASASQRARRHGAAKPRSGLRSSFSRRRRDRPGRLRRPDRAARTPSGPRDPLAALGRGAPGYASARSAPSGRFSGRGAARGCAMRHGPALGFPRRLSRAAPPSRRHARPRARAGGTGGRFLTGLRHPFSGLDHVLAMVAWLWGGSSRPGDLAPPVTFRWSWRSGASSASSACRSRVEIGIGVGDPFGTMVAKEARPAARAGRAMVAFLRRLHGHAHGTSSRRRAASLTASVSSSDRLPSATESASG